jgi:hypothetical protein
MKRGIAIKIFITKIITSSQGFEPVKILEKYFNVYHNDQQSKN